MDQGRSIETSIARVLAGRMPIVPGLEKITRQGLAPAALDIIGAKIA
jgi:hypothetical protein